MNNNFVSTRIKARGSAAAVQGIMHDTRYTVPGYLRRDPEVVFYSFEEDFSTKLGGNKTLDLKEYCRDLIMTSVKQQQARYSEKVKQKADLKGNWSITGIITFSEGSVKDVPNDKLLELGKKAVRKISAELGVKPLYISLHLDEKTAHLHYQLENLNRETGRTVARTIKKGTLTKLQDIAGQIFGEVGLSRGISRETTGKRYKTVAEGHREELKAGEKKVQELKEVIQTYKDELTALKKPAEQRRSVTARFFEILKGAGVLITLQRRKYKSGAWSVETPAEYTDLTKADIKGLTDEIHRAAEGGSGCEWHLKTFGLPPVFCLDDLGTAEIQKMKADGINPLAVVETSPENYQVWVAFENCFGYPERSLTALQWRLIVDYLHEKYGGDAAALMPGHQFRIPGFRRVDKPEWAVPLTETGGAVDFKMIEDAVMERLPAVQQKLERTETIKKVIEENLGVPPLILEGSEGVPEWFIRDKWVRFKTKIMENPPLAPDGDIDWSAVDFRVVRDILRSTKRPDKLLEYQKYSLMMLKSEAVERHKSRNYAELTLDAAVSSLNR